MCPADVIFVTSNVYSAQREIFLLGTSVFVWVRNRISLIVHLSFISSNESHTKATHVPLILCYRQLESWEMELAPSIHFHLPQN